MEAISISHEGSFLIASISFEHHLQYSREGCLPSSCVRPVFRLASFLKASMGGVLTQKTESSGESPRDSKVAVLRRNFSVGVLNVFELGVDFWGVTF